MTKQEFMDVQSKTPAQIRVLQLMLGMSKTQLLTMLRMLNIANKTLYTSEMKQVNLFDLIIDTEIAHTLMEVGYIDIAPKSASNEPDQMENGQ